MYICGVERASELCSNEQSGGDGEGRRDGGTEGVLSAEDKQPRSL